MGWGITGLKKNKWWLALSTAVMFHLLLAIVPLSLNHEMPSSTPSLNIKLQPKPQDKQIPIPDQQALNEPNNLEEPKLVNPPAPKQLDLLTQERQETGSAPTLTIGRLQISEWASQETKQYLDNNKGIISNFAKTFVPKLIEKLPDLKYEDSQAALGGGIYKIRKNGVTCEALTFVPMTFDDYTQGTISTSGKCRETPKIKLELSRGKKD